MLKAACEGKLVAQDASDEPASELLKRILVERRAKWEADLRAKGEDPQKAKYEEPQAPDIDELSELPSGWCWVNLEAVSEALGGYAFSSADYTESGFQIIMRNSGHADH